MADPLGWSLGADGFSDLGTDFLSSNSLENGALDDIDGKFMLVIFVHFLLQLFPFSTRLDRCCMFIPASCFGPIWTNYATVVSFQVKAYVSFRNCVCI